ncbi:MAG: GAF domain-containing protein [Bacilli bacterium]|nr:GAF domain-containing protein [Bacilli bacterium]
MNNNLLLTQAKELIELSGDNKYSEITVLANISSLIFYNFDNINWAGFYYIEDDKFILGPFQGKVACTNIPLSKGMLGKCLKKNETLVITDVHQEKEHIACDSASNSELIIPIKKNDKIILMLDIDSYEFDNFKIEDIKLLEQISKLIENII